MHRLWTIAAVVLSSLAVPALSGDLAKVDRTIAKLPQLTSEHPEYCLLVFGADLHKRVWLVHDGPVLYVDRNGNGDLTEPDERVTADPDYGDPSGGYKFKAGNISDGQLVHKDMQVRWFRLDHLKGSDPRVKALLEQNPKWRGCSVSIDVDMPGQLGSGIGGRVACEASWQDASGLFHFGASPETAPIINFGGPWQITCYSKEPWHLGGLNEFDLAMGTPGIGPGATAFVAYEGVIPPDVKPVVKVVYPPQEEGQRSVEKTYELEHRCCGINLYGDINVPTDVGLGAADVEISLPSWPGATVTPTKHRIDIVPAKPGLKLEPVSWRLKGSLPHVNQGKSNRTCIVEIQFSPDGKRLVAGDYDANPTVQTWDVGTGQRLVKVETGSRHPSNFEFFAISPDWRFVYAPTIRKDRKPERIEKDGKAMMRWTFGDSIQMFDLNTGGLLREFKHSPPRAISYIQMTPDGRYFITLDELAGEYENGPKSTWSLWNPQTGESREFLDHLSGIALFSANCRTSVSVIEKPGAGSRVDCIKVFDFPSCSERATITVDKSVTSASTLAMAAADKIIVGTTTTAENRAALKFWDVSSGRELASVTIDDRCGRLYQAKTSPDGSAVAIACEPEDEKHGGIYIVDVASRRARFVDLGNEVFPGRAAFHLGGKWIVACANVMPKDKRADPDPPYTDVPQPRLYVIDAGTGKIVETLVAPQCFLNSLAFSPDGNTLATSGPGDVLLWDFSTPPGEKPK